MVRFKSSRGFVMPIMVAGFVVVGLLAAIGVINLFKTPNQSSKTASQTIQNNSIQKIADTEITCKHNSGCATNICIFNKCRKADERLRFRQECDESPDCLSENCGVDPLFYSTTKKICLGGMTEGEKKGIRPVEECISENGTTTMQIPGNPSQRVPCMVDDNTFNVKMVFPNIPKLPSNSWSYYYCPKSKLQDCSQSEWGKLKFGGYSDNMLGGSLILCGDGKNGLRINDKDEKDCKDPADGSDYFWPQNTYSLYIAKGKSKDNLQNNVARIATFYVSHFYPKITEPKFQTLSPYTPGQWENFYVDKNKKTVDITLGLQGRNQKGGEDADKYNNYFIKIFSTESDYMANLGCMFLPDDAEHTRTFTLPQTVGLDDPTILSVDLSPGSYVLRVKNGTDRNFRTGDDTTCKEGDFTYYDIPLKIGDKPRTGDVEEEVKDPYGKDAYRQGLFIAPGPICATKDNNGYCTGIPTALGFIIHTEPERFVSDIFTIVLSIGGIAAFGFFIQAGYKLMTSAGNKEKVGAAREQITAAIMGLLFIILSITILEFIGINILHIPGFK